MIVDVTVPVLAESIPDATLLEWNKQPGDAVESGEILIELETDKVVLEVPAPATGVLTEIVKAAGEVALSEEVIARLDTEAVAATAPATAAAASPATPAPDTGAAETEKLSPAVRKLVEEHRIDPGAVSGTGKGGRITKGDILDFLRARADEPPAPAAPEAAAASPPPEAAPPAPPPSADAGARPAGERGERRIPMTRLRARIAERLVEAQHQAAILTTFNEIDMQPVIALRARHKQRFEEVHGARLGFMSFFAKASVLALRRFPAVNAYVDGPDIVYHDYCDIGVAVGSPRGLVVPVLRDVERLTFAEIEQRIAEFGRKAGEGRLAIEEMTGGTFTISNGGVFGSLLSTPILNPPQSAILGMHKIEERPVAENGAVVVRPMMYLALSYDHRIVDGREAVLFLVAIKEALEDPARMLLDL